MTISGPATVAFAFFLATAERQGVAWDRARRHAADRHPQGVHRAEGVDLPAAAAPAADRRPDGVLRRAVPEVPPDQRQRVPHPRGRLDGGPGAGVHARRRVRLRGARAAARARRRRVRAGPVVLLQRHIDFFEEIAKFRAARRIWARWLRDRYGATDRAAMRLRFHTQTAGVSLHRAAADEQRRAHRHRGARRGARRARSRCTRTRSTRCWRCRPRTPPSSRCARSR